MEEVTMNNNYEATAYYGNGEVIPQEDYGELLEWKGNGYSRTFIYSEEELEKYGAVIVSFSGCEYYPKVEEGTTAYYYDF